MYKQLEYLREAVTMVRGQTYRIDLPKSGLLSSIFIKVSGSNVSGATLADESWRLQDFLTTLEIIGNGATVIKSLDYKNAEYFHWLRNKSNPINAWRNYATNTQFEYLPLFFGRKLWDRDYGLDLSKWDNVEFRLTNTASATYYGADFSISLLLGYWRELAGGFRGYLRTEKWREWTTVSDDTQYFLLPSDYPISGVHVRALPDTTTGMADANGANLMDDLDFAMQGGTKRIFKGGLDDLALHNYYEIGGNLITGGLADVNADRGLNYGMLRSLVHAGISGSKDGAVSAVIPTAIADATDGTVSFEAREADSPIEFLEMG